MPERERVREIDPLDGTLTLPALLSARAVDAGERTFIKDLDAGREATYAEMEALTLSWAAFLARSGVAAGDTVVSLLPAGLDAVALWIAAARLGAVEVPVNPGYKGTILAHMLRSSGAKLVVTSEDSLPQLIEIRTQVPGVEKVLVFDGPATHVGLQDWLQPVALEPVAPGELPLRAARPWDAACLMFTSGTTGPSKAVTVTWAQALMTMLGDFPPGPLTSSDHWYVPYPLFHASGKQCVFGAAFHGSQAVLRRRFSLSGFWPDIDQYGCTVTLMIGAVPQLVGSRPPAPEDTRHALKYCLVAPATNETSALATRFDLQINTVYNMTELSVPIHTGWVRSYRGTVGTLRDGYDVRIVDDHDRVLPPGEVGEIIVRASTPWVLNQGYHGLPEASWQAWRNGWFHTGDAGYLTQEGEYVFVDRLKDTIRSRGENISSSELEAEIATHPQVRECAAVGVSSELGEQDVMVAVVPETSEFDVAELLAYCQERLPKFMVPRYVLTVGYLPKTATEKVQKAGLAEAFADEVVWDDEGERGVALRTLTIGRSKHRPTSRVGVMP